MSNRRVAGLLLQPSRRRQTGESSTGTAAASRRRGAASPPPTPPPELDDLPDHQPLELPLSDAALRKYQELAGRSSLARTYESHLKQSATLLREAVGAVNDVHSERQAQLQQAAERREERGRGGDQKSRGETALAEAVAALAAAVGPLTKELELAARETIDRQMELEDEREALAQTAQRLAQWQEAERARQREREQQEAAGVGGARGVRPSRAENRNIKGEGAAAAFEEHQQNGEGEEEEEKDAEEEKEPPPASAFDLLREARETRARDYAQLSTHEKYGLNNDYITFKQTWHDAVHPEGDIALPDAAQWFDANGSPAPYGAGATGAGGREDGGDDDEGEDLVVAREIISFKCPLTLVTMTDPYKSRVCNHTFEKAGIMEFLRHGPQKCPQTGCDRTLRKQDLEPNVVMKRRIERAEQLAQRRNEAAATSDIEADDMDVDGDAKAGDLSVVEGQKRDLKRERQRTREL